ncbi:head-tail connector protein [Methylobacillus pratensis]
MQYRVITPPAAEPVTLEEAKLHLRVDGSEEDKYILDLISVARASCEGFLGWFVVEQTIEMALCMWPRNPYELRVSPVTEVVSVSYSDPEGQVGVLDPDAYRLNSFVTPEQLVFNDALLPQLSPVFDAVKIVMKVGNYGVIPSPVRHAILLYVGHFYANREATAPTGVAEMPLGVQHLLQPYRSWMGV